MVDYLAHLWAWLLACFAIGVAAGALTRRAPARGAVSRWLLWTGLAFAAGALVAALGALRGDAAMFLESGLAAYAAYVAGAVIGTLAAGASLTAHEGWALGVLPAGLAWWGATLYAQPAYEEALQRRVAAVSQRAGLDPAQTMVSGRDLRAAGPAAADARFIAEISRLPGVRRVIIAPGAPAPPPPAMEAPPTPSAPQGSTSPPAGAAPPAVAQNRPAGALTVAECQAALDASATQDRIVFQPARATITRAAALALDKAAAIIRRCPETATIEIGGHAHGVGAREENDALSLRRANAAMRYLQREGVSGRRLAAVGQGAPAPSEKNRDGGRIGSISFTVR